MQRSKHSILLYGSILLSILLHAIEIRFLQRQSLWFHPHVDTASCDWVVSMDKQEKDQILKEAFASLSLSCKTSFAEVPMKAFSALDALAMPSFTPPKIYRLQEEALLQKWACPSPPQWKQEWKHALDMALLPKEPMRPFPVAEPTHSIPSLIPIDFSQTAREEKIEVAQMPKSRQKFEPSLLISIPHLDPTQFVLKEKEEVQKAEVFQRPLSPLESRTASYSQFFDTELVFCEESEGKYIFALTLVPKEDLQLAPLKQNYLFLIDRSNSIQGDRLNITKSAVRKALEELSPNDKFNILAFDQKVDKLSMMPVSCSPDHLAKAAQFLNKIELGSFFSQASLFKPLFLSLPVASASDEVYTAILLTDGESLHHKASIHDLLTEWSFMNQGKVTLYTVGMESDSNLSLLSTIAAFNRGKAVSSASQRGLKRKLLKLMKTIHSPIAKNLSYSAVSRAPKEEIVLLPNENAALLFRNEPYVILGETSSLDDFVLLVQCRLEQGWVHIKKNISFSEGKKGGEMLKSEWGQQKVFSFYQEYLKNNDLNVLAKARSLSRTYALPEIFE